MADYKQCRECIKQDTCTFKILKSKEIDCQYFIDKDLVPRAEVEKFIQEIDQIQKDKAEITYLKEQLIAKAKQEVAREIFEEIEDRLSVHAYTSKSEDYSDGASDTIEWVDKKIAELKKEYIGE